MSQARLRFLLLNLLYSLPTPTPNAYRETYASARAHAYITQAHTHTRTLHTHRGGHSSLGRNGKRLTVKYAMSWQLSHLSHVFLCPLFSFLDFLILPQPAVCHSCAASPALTPGCLDTAAPHFCHSTYYQRRGEGSATKRKQNWLIHEEPPWAAPPLCSLPLG